MGKEHDILENIKALVSARKYRIRLHAVRHMIEEGFDEVNLIEAIVPESKMLEDYPEEMRCLLLGYYSVSEKTPQPLHAVCDYSNPKIVDIVTAYIPQKPWWVTPVRRGRLI